MAEWVVNGWAQQGWMSTARSRQSDSACHLLQEYGPWFLSTRLHYGECGILWGTESEESIPGGFDAFAQGKSMASFSLYLAFIHNLHWHTLWMEASRWRSGHCAETVSHSPLSKMWWRKMNTNVVYRLFEAYYAWMSFLCRLKVGFTFSLGLTWPACWVSLMVCSVRDRAQSGPRVVVSFFRELGVRELLRYTRM